MQSAWKVGLFVVIFVGMLVGAYATLQASVFAPVRDPYYAQFEDAGGLTKGSAVLYSGVKVGEVSSVELSDEGFALVKMEVDRSLRIPEGTLAVLPSSFISIGDYKLLLKPPKRAINYVSPDNLDSPIAGSLLGPLEGILPDTEETMAELNKTMVAFQELLGDKELKGGLVNLMKATEGTMIEGQQTAKQFGKLAGRMDGVIAANAGKVGSMMDSMAVSLESLQAISLELKRVATDGKLEAQANELLATITSAAKEGEGLVKDLRAVTGDEEMRESMKGTLQNFETMSESGVKIASDAEVMAKNGVAISEETKKLLEKANKLADEVGKGLEDLKGVVSKFGEGGGSGLIPKIEVESEIVQQTDPGRLRTDFNAKIPVGKDKLVLGMYDAFESNKLNLQLERPLDGKTDLRYGVYASKPGLGVSYRFAPNLSMQGNLFGLNSTQFDWKLQYDNRTGLYGWVGIERLFKQNSPAIGIGIKR